MCWTLAIARAAFKEAVAEKPTARFYAPAAIGRPLDHPVVSRLWANLPARSPQATKELLMKNNAAVWQAHLSQVERDVIEAHNRVARQREIVAELERIGHRTTAARGMLAAFERLLTMHLADRNRLRKELGGG